MDIGGTIDTVLCYLERKKTYAGLTTLATLAVLRCGGLAVPWWLFIVVAYATAMFLKAGLNRDL